MSPAVLSESHCLGQRIQVPGVNRLALCVVSWIMALLLGESDTTVSVMPESGFVTCSRLRFDII